MISQALLVCLKINLKRLLGVRGMLINNCECLECGNRMYFTVDLDSNGDLFVGVLPCKDCVDKLAKEIASNGDDQK